MYEAQVAAGQNIDLAALLRIDEVIEALRTTLTVTEPTSITVQFVQALRGKCCACGAMNEVPEDQIRAIIKVGAPEATPAETATSEARKPAEGPPTPTPLPPEITSGVKGYRPNVSGSAFHSAVLHNNEVAPLAKLQPSHYPSPRSVSPMSRDGHADPTPRRHNAPPQGSALDDPNPNRKAN